MNYIIEVTGIATVGVYSIYSSLHAQSPLRHETGPARPKPRPVFVGLCSPPLSHPNGLRPKTGFRPYVKKGSAQLGPPLLPPSLISPTLLGMPPTL